MKRILSVLTLAVCAIFMVSNASAQDNYNATTMGEIVRYYETAKWSQGSPFNNQCWTDATQQTHAKTGCVPTAFAIIMRHHGFPTEGIGTLKNGQTDVVITDRTYDYSKMPLTNGSGWTAEQQNEVAKLIAHLGHAFGVTWGSAETSVSIGNTMSERMQMYFNYNYTPVSNQYAGSGQMYDFETWKNNLKNSLLNGCPVPYASNNQISGGRHMFIVDGFTENDYFHFNFGWGGGTDGWFKLDNITPTGDNYSWLNSSDGYDSKHQAYFNLMPNTTTYAVTATVNDSNKGTVSINNGTAGSTATASLMQGVTATLTAHPAQGYALASWTKNGVVVGSKNTIQVTVGTDANDYVANFDDAANVYVIKDYIISPSTVGLTGSSKESVVNYVTSDEYPAALSLASTATNGASLSAMSRINDDQIRLYAYDQATSNTTVKYTLSVPDGYQITEYKFDYSLNSTTYPCTITYSGGTISPNNTTWTSSPVIVNNAKTAEFTMTAEKAHSSSNFYIKNFTVTIAKEGAEGGSSTPTTKTYTVTTEANPADGGTAKFSVGTGSQKTQGDVNSNEQITLYAVANTDYTFVNWTLNGNPVSTSETCNVTVSQAANYVANFEAEAAEPVLPITGTEVNATFAGATGFVNGGYTNQVVLQTAPAITFSANDAKIGHSTVDGTKHPYLFKGTDFTISVPAPYKIAGYKLTVQGHNFNAGTFTYTVGTQNAAAAMRTAASARSNTATATISGTTPLSVVATGLNTSEINIGVGSASAATAGIIVKELQLDLVQESQESEPEYTLGDRLTSVQLMSVTKPTHIAVKNLSKTNNWYFAGTTNVENFGNEAVFVWTPKTEGVAGEYYLKTLNGEYLKATGDNTAISYTEDVANAAVFTTLKPVAGSTGTSKLDKDSDTGDYVDNDELLVRFMTKYSGGTGDVTTWINVTNTTSPNHPKYYNGGFGMYTAHFVYAVSVDGVAPELPDVLFPDGAYEVYWKADNRGYLAYHGTDYPNEAKLAGVTYTDCQNLHYAVNQVDLVWYLITASDGKRYLFEVATGKFLGVDTSVQANGTGNKLSTSEAWAIAVEPNTHSTRLGHYIITTMISGTKNLLCSGCGTPKAEHPVRWLPVNDTNQKDGGAPLQLIPVNDVTVADNVMNAVLAVINGTDEPEQPTDPLAGKYFRLKEKSTGNYMNIANTSNNTGATSGVTVVAKNESSNNQIFLFEQSGDGYKLKANSGNYIKCHNWNANANTTDANEATVLTFEPTGNELEYLIKWDNKHTDSDGTELDDYFKVQNVNGTVYVFDNATSGAAATWVLEEVVMQKVYIKAVVDGWRNDNPNTHLGTITIGGTPMKLTPEHLTASELTMPLAEGTALAFTRKYRGFEFQGFYIGETELDPTLTADNVAAIDENNPLVAKFTATDDVTLFYDDDTYSYRIPAIAKTGTNRLVAVSDYRHSLDDIGRDQHGTGTNRVDLVMRTSDDNGATWSAKQTIAEGTSTFGYGDAAIAANGQDILVMAVAGNVFFTSATSSNKQRTYRIYSTDNGVTWKKEEVSSNLYTLFPNANGMFFGSGKLVVDPDFNGTGNARVYGAMLLNDGNNYVLYSDNWGETWNILGGTSPASANEPKVEILPNGQILLSSRRGGGRTFNVFTYTDKANSTGTWSTATNGCDNGGNSTNGEIICLDAKKPNGKLTKILLQSQPYGSDRRNVSIWYKEISADETYTGTSIASDWTMGKQVSTQLSAYSAMCLQANGEIALFFEEAPCYGDDHTKGYSMVYVPLTIEEITGENFLNPNADVETVTVDVTLTDNEGNTYTHQFDYLPGDAAAIDAALMTAYPFITELGEGNLQGSDKSYTYTNTVKLPFRVSNANKTVWYNIYWPSYNPSSGKIGCPVYLSATDGEQNVPKVTADALYGASEYNTLDWADRLSWAVYSVNNSLTFKFKNKSADKYIQVTSVATGNAQNVVYADEKNATAFELLPDSYSYAGDYALVAKVDETTGYLCSTSATGYHYATHYNGINTNRHEGAWVVFKEEEVVSIINDLNTYLGFFGKEKQCVINDEVQAIITALENPNDIKLNTLKEYASTLDYAYNNWPKLTIVVDENAGSVTINNEARKNKKAPNGFEFTVVATPASGYRFTHWSNGTTNVSTDASYTFNMPDAATELTANFEKSSNYYHLISRATDRHEHLYNNAFSNGNTNHLTLQSDAMIKTNNGIWHITKNGNQLDIKNGDGKPVVAGNNSGGIMGTYSQLNIAQTINADYTYYYFTEALNCSNTTSALKVGGVNYLTTWSDGGANATDNQWRLVPADTEGKNIYDVVVECTEQDVYVTYGSGTDEGYAFNGGFFITDETIEPAQLTAKKGNAEAQGVKILVESNTIRVVDAEPVGITVSTSPAEGGTVTINGEDVDNKQVAKDSEVRVVATPANGYSFVNWTDAGGNEVSTEASYTFKITAATELTANFEKSYPEVTGNTNANNYLKSVTTEGGRTNVNYSANTHPGEKVVTIGTVQIGRGESFSMNLIAYSLGVGSTSAVREDMRYCHASLFTDFDGDRTFGEAAQTWGVKSPSGTNPYAGGSSHVYGNYDLVMDITANITVPVDAPLGESHVRMIYTNAWKDWPTNGTTTLDKGIVYDIIVEVVEDVTITVGVATENTGTVTINGEATSTKQVVKSSNVTVEATPANGYHFVNWTDAGGNEVSTDASYTFTASENTSLVANFEADVVYHTITVSTYYNNNGGTVKVGEEDATSVNVAEGESVRMLATVAKGYEFMGWLKDGVIVKNAINNGLDFEVQGPDYTLYEIKASAEYKAVFSKITDYTNLEDGKAYRICAVSESCAPRYIYRKGTELMWKNDDGNFDDNSIFVVQKNGNSVNLISAIGYHGWKASNKLGNDEQYNPYAAIKVTYGTKDETRSLYLESGTSSGIYTTLPNNVFAFMNTPSKNSLPIMDADNRTTNFLFEEVDTYAFQVSAADGSNAKLGTVNLPFATTVPAEVTVYGVNDSNEDYVYVAPLKLTDNVLPANTPVLIEAAASGKYGFKPAPASANVYETGWAGTLEAEEIPGTTNAYILSYKGVGTPIKMYKLSSTDRTINANKAYYIDSTGKASALQFVFGGTTDIEDVEREGNEDTIYDLQGRKLSEITEPGFYIIDGKKVWVK